MLSILKSKFKSVAGVGLTISKEGDWSLKYCILDRAKDDIITISKKGENVSSVKELSEIIGNDIPIFVFINGKGILNKIHFYKENQKEPVLKEIFPGAKLDNLHLQVNALEDKCLVSIIGKDLLKQIAEEMKSNNLSTVEYAINPYVFEVLLPFINSEKFQAPFGNIVFNIRHREIIDVIPANFERREQIFSIGEEVVEERYIPVYAAGLNLFVHEEQEGIPEAIQYLSYKGEWKQKEIFRKSLKIVLGSLFFLLTINSIFFFYFTAAKEKLDEQFLQKSTRLSHLNNVREELTEKKNFLKSIGWLSNTQTALFVDRMGALVPDGLLLTTINVHLLNKKLSESFREQVFDNNLIFVEGKCKNPLTFNEYLNRLKTLDWVEMISQQEYRYSENEGIGYFRFEIVLK